MSWCDDVVVQRDGGGWKIEVADDWQRPMWGGNSSRGTGEPCLGDTGELLLQAYGGSAAEHRASAARSGADVEVRRLRGGLRSPSAVQL